MSEDVEVLQKRAFELGWRPLPADPENPTKDEFKGDSEKFVEAEEYVARGERILPIVREHNKQLEADLRATKVQLQETLELQRASAEAIETLRQSHEADVQREVAKTRAKLLKEIKEARTEGDVDKEYELRDDLDALPAEQPKAKALPASPPAPRFGIEFLSWQAANPWYGTDLRRTGLADGIAAELRKEKNSDGTLKYAYVEGKDFFDLVGKEVETFLKPAARSKVEGGRGSSFSESSDDTRSGSGRGYAELPGDAKVQCEAEAKTLVGPGRAFKTKPEWQKYYAEQYWRA